MPVQSHRGSQEHNIAINPATNSGVTQYITMLADSDASLSIINRISPALTLLHEYQNHGTAAAIQSPFIKLLLSGAKREAAVV